MNESEEVQGLSNHLFNINLPDWIAYGYLPIVITLSLNYFTLFFLLMSVALSSINSSLEEMADVMGASRFTVLRKITLPLVMPAILSALILTYSKSIGSFGVTGLSWFADKVLYNFYNAP